MNVETGETMFFTYRQNNSGGSFDFDPSLGISVTVIIEARNARIADVLAEDTGIYFDGEGDCSCCGDRWYRAASGYNEQGDTEPRIYGVPVEEFEPDYKWMRAGEPEAFVHFADGRIEGHGA